MPFLTFVLVRDSRYWSRCGFTACLMGDASAGSATAPPHRVPLLTQRSTGSGYLPRFMIVDASKLRFGARIGQGSSSVARRSSTKRGSCEARGSSCGATRIRETSSTASCSLGAAQAKRTAMRGGVSAHVGRRVHVSRSSR